MTDKIEVTPKQAAEQLNDLLREKREVEEQIDRITAVKRIIGEDKERDRNPKSIVYVESNNYRNETQFDIGTNILAEAAQTMLDKHAARLSEINDSLLFMVKLIK